MPGKRYRDIRKTNEPTSWEFWPITAYCGLSVTDQINAVTNRSLVNPLLFAAYCDENVRPSGENVTQLDGVTDDGIVTDVFYSQPINLNQGLPTPIQNQRRLERKYLVWAKQNQTGTFLNVYKILTISDRIPKYPLYMQIQTKWLGILQDLPSSLPEATIRY